MDSSSSGSSSAAPLDSGEEADERRIAALLRGFEDRPLAAEALRRFPEAVISHHRVPLRDVKAALRTLVETRDRDLHAGLDDAALRHLRGLLVAWADTYAADAERAARRHDPPPRSAPVPQSREMGPPRETPRPAFRVQRSPARLPASSSSSLRTAPPSRARPAKTDRAPRGLDLHGDGVDRSRSGAARLKHARSARR